MRTSNSSTSVAPMRTAAEFGISTKDVEGLVLEIKENLRISASSLKALPYRRYPKKYLRNSPYSVGTKMRQKSSSASTNNSNNNSARLDEDPYELLQRLLRDGSLVNEAVRRVQRGGLLQPKPQCYYDSDEDSNSPVLRLYSQDSN